MMSIYAKYGKLFEDREFLLESVMKMERGFEDD